MASAKQFLFGSALLLGGVRLAFVLIRATAPHTPAVMPMDPEAISQREERRGEQRAELAKLLDASVIDLEDREALDQARGDASRTLRELAREANTSGASGHSALGLEAIELDRALLHDARTTCSLDALRKLDAASSALTPEARAPLAERLAIVHRHVKRTCELATR